MLSDVIDYLICPICAMSLRVDGAVRCARGHSFDIARQGYVNLLTGPGGAKTGDTPEMVDARVRFLAAGHYAPVADHLARLCADARVVADAGAGTGYYLAHALNEAAVGIALDLSTYAVRRAARAHPRIGAVVADVWRDLPIREGAVDVLVNVFAPRHPAEFARVLCPGGRLVVVTPARGHLHPLVDRLGLLAVDEDKEHRLARSLHGFFTPDETQTVRLTLQLDHPAVAAVVGMGPSAWHTTPDLLAGQIRDLPDPVPVTAAFRITSWQVRK